MFTEVIVAPDATEDAIQIIATDGVLREIAPFKAVVGIGYDQEHWGVELTGIFAGSMQWTEQESQQHKSVEIVFHGGYFYREGFKDFAKWRRGILPAFNLKGTKVIVRLGALGVFEVF